MKNILRAIRSDTQYNYNTQVRHSNGFKKLVLYYKEALNESLGNRAYSHAVDKELLPDITSLINANLMQLSHCMNK